MHAQKHWSLFFLNSIIARLWRLKVVSIALNPKPNLGQNKVGQPKSTSFNRRKPCGNLNNFQYCVIQM